MLENLEELIEKIDHLGYKITNDPLNSSVWKIVCPSSNRLYSLDSFDGKVSLYEDDVCLCSIEENQDLFSILRFLPRSLNINNDMNLGLNDLYAFCGVTDEKNKKIIRNILNHRRPSNFKSLRDYAYYIAQCLSDAKININNQEADLSIIDVILKLKVV